MDDLTFEFIVFALRRLLLFAERSALIDQPFPLAVVFGFRNQLARFIRLAIEVFGELEFLEPL